MACVKENFHIHINPSCGFHVHLGVGARERIPTEVLRRFGALVWAAEPLLASLHPPERALSKWAPSVRLTSHLAKGATKTTAMSMRSYGRPFLRSEDCDKNDPHTPTSPLSEDDQNLLSPPSQDYNSSLAPYPGEPWNNLAAISRHEAYVLNEDDDEDEDEDEDDDEDEDENEEDGPEPGPAPSSPSNYEAPNPLMKGVFPAALHLLQCETSCQVARLL